MVKGLALSGLYYLAYEKMVNKALLLGFRYITKQADKGQSIDDG